MDLLRVLVGQDWEAIYDGRPISFYLAEHGLPNLSRTVFLMKQVIKYFLRLWAPLDRLLVSIDSILNMSVS